MDTPTFADLMAQERARIQEAMKAAKAKRQEAEREMSQLEAQVAAIKAYDAALKGKAVPKEPRERRGRRGEKREALRELIAQHPEGLTRGEVLAAMHARGDKAAEQSVSNALAALKKAGRLVQEGKTYKVSVK
jgi:hypothetical protein